MQRSISKIKEKEINNWKGRKDQEEDNLPIIYAKNQEEDLSESKVIVALWRGKSTNKEEDIFE